MAINFLGWAMAMNRWSDEIGTMHLLAPIGDTGQAAAVCGVRPFSFGGIEQPADASRADLRGQPCARCLKKRRIAYGVGRG